MKRIQYNGNRLVFRIAPLVCLEGRCAFSADGAPVAILLPPDWTVRRRA